MCLQGFLGSKKESGTEIGLNREWSRKVPIVAVMMFIISLVILPLLYFLVPQEPPPIHVAANVSSVQHREVFFNTGDPVYIEGHVTLLDNSKMRTGFVLAVIWNDHDFDGVFQSLFAIALAYNAESESWQGIWHSTGEGKFRVTVEASNIGGISKGTAVFHLYPNSGVSCYALDWDSDGHEEYVLENRHILAVYQKDAKNAPLELIRQKDLGITYSLTSTSDLLSPGCVGAVIHEDTHQFFGDITSADNLALATLFSRCYYAGGIELLMGGPIQDFNVSVWEYLEGEWYEANKVPVTQNDWGRINDIEVSDIDGDSELETIVGSQGNFVQIFEYENGSMQLTHNISLPGAWITMLAVGDLDNDGDPNLEILVSYQPPIPLEGRPEAVILKKNGTSYQEVFGSYSSYSGSGGAACAVGDIDNNGDMEFVVTEEFPGEVCRLRLYDWNIDNWTEIATYDFEMDGSGTNWIYQVQIIDADNDGINEIFVNPQDEPPQILEYIVGELVCGWKSPYNGNWHMSGSIAGDITNDGLVDIVIADSAENLLYIFETRNSEIVNTFNINVLNLGDSTENGMDIGDLDNDGLNEFIYLDTPGNRILIFHNDTLVETIEKSRLASDVVTIGDYDNDLKPDYFHIEIQLPSQDADYLIYRCTEFNTINTTFYFPISGHLGSFLFDDRYNAGPFTGFITNLTYQIWTNFTLLGSESFVVVHDNETGTVLGFAQGAITTNIILESVGVWNENNQSEALRIHYNTSQVTSTDYLEFLLAFTQGNATTISNHMNNIITGIYPETIYDFPTIYRNRNLIPPTKEEKPHFEIVWTHCKTTLTEEPVENHAVRSSLQSKRIEKRNEIL